MNEHEQEPAQERAPGPRRGTGPIEVVASLGILALVLLAYGPVLDNFFHEIDDPGHLWGGARGTFSSPRFRPLHLAWNVAAYRMFGTRPFPYYLANLLLHAANAVLVLALVRSLVGRSGPAVVAGIVFALFYSPHGAVLWIAAAPVLWVELCILATSIAFLAHLRSGRALPYVLSLAFMVVGMGFKEDVVLLGPLLVGMHVAVRGWRSALRPRELLRYVPFVVLAIVYLALAYKPEIWTDASRAGRYHLSLDSIPKLLRNLAVLAWPGHVTRAEEFGWLAAPGLLVLAFLAVTGFRLRSRHPSIALGLVVVLAGFLPTLPGPFEIAGGRYAYPSAIGVALGAGGLAAWTRERLGWAGGLRWAVGAALALGFTGWCAVQVLAIRSVEGWRYAPRCALLERLIEGSRTALDEASAAGDSAVIVIAPPVFGAIDYARGVSILLDVPDTGWSLEWVRIEDDLLDRLGPGGELDPERVPIYASTHEGELHRVRERSEAPLEEWRARAAAERKPERRGAVALVRFEVPR